MLPWQPEAHSRADGHPESRGRGGNLRELWETGERRLRKRRRRRPPREQPSALPTDVALLVRANQDGRKGRFAARSLDALLCLRGPGVQERQVTVAYKRPWPVAPGLGDEGLRDERRLVAGWPSVSHSATTAGPRNTASGPATFVQSSQAGHSGPPCSTFRRAQRS
jgi:hypothetical protein